MKPLYKFALATVSMKEMLRIFGKKATIMEIQANGSRQLLEKGKCDDIDAVKAQFSEDTKSQFVIKNRRHDASLDHFYIPKLLRLFNKYNIEDAAVTYLVIRFKGTNTFNRMIRVYADNASVRDDDEYIAVFISKPITTADEKKTVLGYPINYNLILHHKFKLRMLDLEYLINIKGQNFIAEKSRKPLIHWADDNFEQIVSPHDLVLHLKNKWEYGVIKTYKLTKENKLIVVGIE